MAVTATNVLFYYPNLIGYIRVICMVASFYYALSNWKLALVAYTMAFVGDVVDGHVARAFKQSSTYGGVLDMVTDRVSTCGFLVILSNLYPKYLFPIIMLIVLDIGSHWFHVLSVTGHHKSKEALEKRNFILRWYYAFYPVFGYCCVGTEVFFILNYVLHFYPNETLRQICFYGCLPGCIVKQIVNVAQFCSAAETIAQRDADEANKGK